MSKQQKLLERIIDRDAGSDLMDRMKLREKYSHKTFEQLEKIWEDNK